jgi:hypothetical protein
VLAAPLMLGATRAPNHCTAQESVLYTCTLGRAVVSVCEGPGAISYRYGPIGKPDLSVSSSGTDGKLHAGVITGGGGGRQDSLRFSNHGYEYIVYSAVAGSLTGTPGLKTSGLTVMKWPETVSERACGQTPSPRLTAPRALVTEEPDERYEMWF